MMAPCRWGAGSPAFDRPRHGTYLRPSARRNLPLWVLLLAAAVAHPVLLRDGTLPTTLLAGAVSLLAPQLAYPVPDRFRPVTLLVFVAGFLYAVQGAPTYAVTVFLALTVGTIAALDVQWYRQRTRREASAVGAPPSGRDPQHAADVGDFAKWDDGTHEYEAVEPDLTTVLEAVRALDGVGRSYLATWRGGRRLLLVGGDAAGAMVVIQTDDKVRWNIVVDHGGPAGSGDADEEVEIGFGGLPMRYPRERTTTDLAAAETAVRTWVENREQAGTLTWWRETRYAQVPRPASLRRAGI